jgi:hypothetical protein
MQHFSDTLSSDPANTITQPLAMAMSMLNMLLRLAVIVTVVPITVVPVPWIVWQLLHILRAQQYDGG